MVLKITNTLDKTPFRRSGKKLSTRKSLYYSESLLLRPVLVIFQTAILIAVLTSCSSLTFYTQAVVGQSSLLWQRQDISQVLKDPSVNDVTRTRLELVNEILAFAENELSLPVGDAYSTYVSTGKPYIVWNVFAAPLWSLTMKSFCYPIAGCVSYQGYFKESKAHELATRLEKEGYDVYVGGVTAYSTLGWFSDPVLDTFLLRSELGLVSLLFHELAHKVIYLPGDTTFNESFATTLAEEGLRRWLLDRGEETRFQEYQNSRQRKDDVISLIKRSRGELKRLYASGASVEEMGAKKTEILNQLPAGYELLRRSWTRGTEFQSWMTMQSEYSELNNAKLGAIADYNGWVPAFLVLLLQQGGEIELFVESVKELGRLEKPQRDEYLSGLLARAGKVT